MRNVLLLLIAALAIGAAQDKPPAHQNTPKSPEEAALINAVAAEKDPIKLLAGLDEWVKQFPDSDWKDLRPGMYLRVYQQAGKMREAFDKANEILATKPDDFEAITAVLRIGPTLNNNAPSPADLDAVEKTAEYVMKNGDKVFADSNRPDIVTAADWPKVKPYWGPQSRIILVTSYTARKDDARMEAKLKEKAAEYPNDPIFPLALLNAYFQQIKAHPDKQPLVLFYYARAASIDGPMAPTAAEKQKYMASFSKNYKIYHGSEEGLNDVVALAKANPVAPGDFKIKSTVEIAQEKADAEAKENAANPAMAIWKTVKTGLTSDTPDQFFESVKDAGFPGKDSSGQDMKWKAKIVSMKPALRPKTLVVAVEKVEGDVTLNVSDGPLAGKMEPGEEIQFEGVAKAYTKDPYMLTLEVTKDQIVGWTGKNTPATTKKSPGTAKKQAQ
jgi:hypothetical protein